MESGFFGGRNDSAMGMSNASETLQMASVQEVKGYLVERYPDLGLINLVEMYR